VINHAADRAPHICQAQSLNIFLPANIDKWDLHMLHWSAWEKGVKSLYYCRSKSIQRASFAGKDEAGKSELEISMQKTVDKEKYGKCGSCE